MKRIITAVLFAVLLCGCEKPKEEVLFYNGTVLTMEESRAAVKNRRKRFCFTTERF